MTKQPEEGEYTKIISQAMKFCHDNMSDFNKVWEKEKKEFLSTWDFTCIVQSVAKNIELNDVLRKMKEVTPEQLEKQSKEKLWATAIKLIEGIRDAKL